MSTYLDLKTAVTGQLGGADATTYVAKRETAINRARRRYYSEKRWSYLKVDDATLTFSNQVATLPSDFNLKYDPNDVYFYSGNIKYAFNKTNWGNIQSYLTDQYVYAVNKKNKQIKINHSEISTLTLEYFYLPSDYTATDGSQDSSVEPAPDTTAIELLSIALWWDSKERDQDRYDNFLNQYKAQLAIDKEEDAISEPVRFFRPARPYIIKGYISKF